MSACIFRSQKVNEETADLVETHDTGTYDLDTPETDTFMPIDLTEYRDTIVGNFSGHGADTLISEPTVITKGVVVRGIISGDTKCKEPVLSFHRQKNENGMEWIKPLQTLKTTSPSGINIYFRYAKPINGYTVTCRFMPFSNDCETGHIIIKFQDGKSDFLYINNDVYSDFYTNYIAFDEGDITKWRNGDVYVLDYIPPTFTDFYKECNDNSPLGYYTPFQFLDINFDGEKELLINDYCRGQQGNNYKAYKIQGNTLKPIDNHLPFSMLDNMAKIDVRNKRIITYIHDGCFFSGYFFFTRKSRASFHITEIPNFQWDYTKKIMDEYKAHPNFFSIDSISELMIDTVFEYRRNRTKLELVNSYIRNIVS